jgi:Domain of unknown function (DUF4234)
MVAAGWRDYDSSFTRGTRSGWTDRRGPVSTTTPHQNPPEDVQRGRKSPLLGQLAVDRQPTHPVVVPSRTPSGVVRRPVVVLVLTAVTLGLYSLYWWYEVNREMADVGRAWGTPELGERPLMSLLAVFPGCLLIVRAFRTSGRLFLPPPFGLGRGSE